MAGHTPNVVERAFGGLFIPDLERRGIFGERQFAYASGKSHRDALALSVLSWLLHLEHGFLVALYCSDVSGAFDRVCERTLRDKLARAGLHPRIFRLLCSWLGPRVSAVVLDGVQSATQPLKNSVYRGTVLPSPSVGPPLR